MVAAVGVTARSSLMVPVMWQLCLMSLITTAHASPLPHTHMRVSTPSSSSSLLSLSFSPTLLPCYPRPRQELSFFYNLVANWRIRACPHMRSGLHLSPLSSVHKQFVQDVYLHISANLDMHLHTWKERGEKQSTDSRFDSFSMETFVQLACLQVCQPGQCFSYETRGETFLYNHRGREQSLNWHRHTCIHTHSYVQTRLHRAISPDFCHFCSASIRRRLLLLTSCWQVPESLLSLGEG